MERIAGLTEGTEGPEEPFVIKRSLKPLSPSGDLGKRDDEPYDLFFKRKIKKAGGEIRSSKEIPWRGTDAMEGDKGSGVREVPKDQVV